MLIRDLELDEQIKDIFRLKDGIRELYPPQIQTVEAGLLKDENLVLAIPTASGKTLVAELAALNHFRRQKGKTLYLCPLRALASEKYEEFQRFKPLGVRVGMSSGDFDADDRWLASADIIISTNEKMDALLRHNVEWINHVSLIVIDECHLIDDVDRGPTLEILIARLRSLLHNVQILALSATIRNADEIANWLEAKLISSDWRPVSLKEGVFFEGSVYFNDGSSIDVADINADPKINLIYDIVSQQAQALVFNSSRRNAEGFAKRIRSTIKKDLPKEALKELKKLAKEVEEADQLSKKLALCVRNGVAFHHAGLNARQRRIIEHAFKKNVIRVISATPTLSAGINIPARRVIISSVYRFERGAMKGIKVLEYKQMSGRAGRPKYDPYGEAVTLAQNQSEMDDLKEHYIKAEPERVISKLASQPALRKSLLGLISSHIVKNEDELLEFFEKTLYIKQSEVEFIIDQIKRVLHFLRDEEFINYDDYTFSPTTYGIRVAQLYLDPLSAAIIRNGMDKAIKKEKSLVTPVAILQLLATTPDMINLYLRKRDWELLDTVLAQHEEEFLEKIPEPYSIAYESFLQSLKTALLMEQWINEASMEKIVREFNVGSGDVARYAETARWLSYAGAQIAKLLFSKESDSSWVIKIFADLELRVLYGVKEEAIALCNLKGVGRVRARALIKAGIKSLADLKAVEPEKLQKIPGFGTEIVRSIKEQLLMKKSPQHSPAFENDSIDREEATQTQKDLLDYLS
ncbi:MAG: DEAD/DEAH box helicase [Promethearchaeota archaeon]